MRISDWSSDVCSSDLFRRYDGTLGGLFRQIQRSMGVTIWWNEGIYVSPVGRYSVMLPQNKDLMAQVVSELQAKGAKNVVASLQAGTVSFVAPGDRKSVVSGKSVSVRADPGGRSLSKTKTKRE